MQYTCYTITITSKPEGLDDEVIYDLYSDALGGLGFDSFDTNEGVLKAYIPTELLADNSAIKSQLGETILEGVAIEYVVEDVPDVNWNEEWEKHYFQPIMIGDKLCRIRAPFHTPDPEAQTEIIISPKMAFGTGNHETTALMMGYIIGHSMKGLRVLDMGCGTGILGILALKQGAECLTAIDIDEWAYLNVLENAELNGVHIEEAMQGDASSLAGKKPYDLILANITRNILLADMPAYVAVLKEGGHLILSGFYEEDVEVLTDRAKELGLSALGYEVRNRWTRLELVKK